MRLKNKNILIFLSIGIVLIVSIFFSLNKKEYHELPKVKIKESIKNKQFALLLEQTKGKGDYKESAGELPTEGYVFNESKSGCTDLNGKIIDGALNYDYETYTVLVDTSKTSYCYLYYDIEPNIKYLRDKDTDNHLTNELTGGMYRYQGTDNVFNWICFGTSNQEECKSDIDKYMYRIIGINAKGELYLLKETFLKEGEVNGFAWNDQWSMNGSAGVCPNGVCPEWNEANLFRRINGISNGTKAGIGGETGKSDTDIFVDSEYYDYLKSGDKINGGENASDWYKLIQTHSWYYGDTTVASYDGDTLYNIETGASETTHYVKGEAEEIIGQKYTWTNTVNAKISLMYLHDVAYAYPGGNPDNIDNVKNSWIHFRKDGYNNSLEYEWLSTRLGFYSPSLADVGARYVFYTGLFGFNLSRLYSGNGVRPVFYLSNEIELTGEGTLENPFQIKNLNYILN